MGNIINTQEMLNIALKLANLNECPADSAVIVPGENIKNALVGIDIDTPELLVAKMMGYDCVVSHHPRNVDLKGIDKLFRDAQTHTMYMHGVPFNEAQKLIEIRAIEIQAYDHSANFNRTASAAQVLGVPFLCVHTPADVIVENFLQKMFDEKFGDKPQTRLREIIEVLDMPEYKQSVFEPMIAVGAPESYAGKILVIMSGVTGGGPDVYKAYFRAGVGTLVLMYAGEDDIKAIAEQKIGNIVIAGHMASDSYGMNRIIELWEQNGMQITRMSGLLNPQIFAE